MKKYMGEGARNYAQKFYGSKSWRTKSLNYRKAHPLCERCLKRGLYVPSECVHHKIHINKHNYHDWKILLDDDNLEALCNECHAKEHSGQTTFEFSADGSFMGVIEKGDKE